MAGSASTWVLGVLSGPPRSARVVHAGRDAAYLDLHGTCLGVLAARAVQVPCGVRTMLPALPELVSGTEARLCDGAVELPGLRVTVSTVVDPLVPMLSVGAAERGRPALERLAGDRLDQVIGQLPAEPLRQLAASDPDAVAGLLGLGGGLTPLGDDVLAGWLATAVAVRHPALAAVRGAVACRARRTTPLSATLLLCAARGEGVPQFRDLLSGIADDDSPTVSRSLDAVLAIGDTSGGGLVLGALTALRSLAFTSTQGAHG